VPCALLRFRSFGLLIWKEDYKRWKMQPFWIKCESNESSCAAIGRSCAGKGRKGKGGARAAVTAPLRSLATLGSLRKRPAPHILGLSLLWPGHSGFVDSWTQKYLLISSYHESYLVTQLPRLTTIHKTGATSNKRKKEIDIVASILSETSVA